LHAEFGSIGTAFACASLTLGFCSPPHPARPWLTH